MAIEIVIFRLQPEVSKEEFQAAAAATTSLLETQTGFISRTIGQSESGEWLDILYWDSVDSAKKAIPVFQNEPDGKRFSGYMNPQGIQVFYVETGSP